MLERLGLDKKGRKADLQARVAAYFGEAANGAVQPPREQYKIDAAGSARSTCLCNITATIGYALLAYACASGTRCSAVLLSLGLREGGTKACGVCAGLLQSVRTFWRALARAFGSIWGRSWDTCRPTPCEHALQGSNKSTFCTYGMSGPRHASAAGLAGAC